MAAPNIFDRSARARIRARAERVGAGSFLLRDAAENLHERISSVNRRFSFALDVGSRRQSFTKLEPLAETWVRMPIAYSDSAPPSQKAVVAEEDALPFANGSFDLVVSTLSLHSVNDLPGALIQIRRILVPDGLFVAALFGGATLGELRRAFALGENETMGGASPRIVPFADVRDLGGLLQRAGFALPVADVERVIVRYRDFFTLAHDLRSLGETNSLAARSRKPLRRGTLSAALARYADDDSEPDGRLRATFETIYLTGWAPHENQPQPLKPGSARMRLRDALG